MKEEKEKQKQEKQKLIKVKREQIINKSDVYFILNTISLVIFLYFFFMVIGGFSGLEYTIKGGAMKSAMSVGFRIVMFASWTIFTGVFYLIIYEMRKTEQEKNKKNSIYKTAGKNFWRWLWSDIKRSKK